MTVLIDHEIQMKDIVHPCLQRGVHADTGLSFGLSRHAYDISIKQGLVLMKGEFLLASTVESFSMPNDVMGIVHDKSSLVRKGLSVFNTVLDAGWKGFLTLELVYHGPGYLELLPGQPIAQVVFHKLTGPVRPYAGKYQNQPDRPVESLKEGS